MQLPNHAVTVLAGSVDDSDQANCYQAFFEVWPQYAFWMEGAFWWDWSVSAPTVSTDTGYSRQGKSAELWLDKYFGSALGTTSGFTLAASNSLLPVGQGLSATDTIAITPVTVTITGTSGSLSATTSIALTVSAVPGFTIGTGGTTSMTIEPGATTGNTGTISVVGTNGFSGTVNLSCTVTTAMTTVNDKPICSLSPTSVSISGTTAETSTLTVTTTAATAGNQMRKLFWPSAGGTEMALVLLFWVPRRRNWLAMLGLLVLSVAIGTVGCGGGSSSSKENSGTTAGLYTVTVTGTSGTASATVGTVAVTVQ